MKNYISINNRRIELTDDQIEKIRSSLDMKTTKLGNVPAGETVKIGKHEMIVLEHLEGTTFLLRKDLLKERQEFGESNLYVGSYVDVLCQEFGAEIAAIVGDDNVILHEVDLTADDGLKDYGTIQRYASLLTADQARRYVEVLDMHKVDVWWWLATPWSTPKHNNSTWIKCVSPSGDFNRGNFYFDNGVRPFCILNSNIFVSN